MVRNVIDNVIENITVQLNKAMRNADSQEEIAYASGLADSLEIIKEEMDNSLKIGREYYVLALDSKSNNTIIEQRILSKITATIGRTAYCFSLGKHDSNPIVLYSGRGLVSRVFNNYDDAVRGKNHVYLNQKIQY